MAARAIILSQLAEQRAHCNSKQEAKWSET